MTTVRVAAAQFGAGQDLDDNLATTLRMIDEAAKVKPDLLVLPEFCNHLSWYEDKAHCYKVSVPLDGPWLGAVGAKASEHGFFIVINCTVQREGELATGTSVLFDRQGKVLVANDKQVLMGHENDFLEKSTELCPIVETELGRIGLYACMDGVINETPRSLGLRGAQIMCNSLNSFALDEASLHVPVRAPENRAFVVAANKVGPLIPEFLLEPVSEQTSIPIKHLCGAGESQIVAPDGTVLAKASLDQEEVVYADIDVSQADNKKRPDGTDVFAARRPAIYAPLAEEPPAERSYRVGAESAEAAVYQPRSEGESAIVEVAGVIVEAGETGVQLLTLPEMFCFEGGVTDDPEGAVARSDKAIKAIATACKEAGGDIVVSTSLVTKEASGIYHTGVLINEVGILLAQGQLHESKRHPWSKLVDAIKIEPLPWARTAVIVGDDALYPETFRLAALQNAEVVALPFTLMEAWELQTGLVERAAENRLCLVAATRGNDVGGSLIATLWKDFTIMTPWETRPFDGNISYPILKKAEATPGLTQATIHPANAQNKMVSQNTNVLDGRPWHLAAAITEAQS